MRIGVIADTHDRLEKIDKAVAFFNSSKLDLVVHAGDFVAPFTARSFIDLDVPLVGIFGNNDGEKKGLTSAFKEIGRIHEPPHVFKVKQRSIIVLHDCAQPEEQAKEHDIVVYAHTHQYEVKKPGNAIIVNPGECCGYLSGTASVAIIDTAAMEVNIFELQM